jgi:hypothetical protein
VSSVSLRQLTTNLPSLELFIITYVFDLQEEAERHFKHGGCSIPARPQRTPRTHDGHRHGKGVGCISTQDYRGVCKTARRRDVQLDVRPVGEVLMTVPEKWRQPCAVCFVVEQEKKKILHVFLGQKKILHVGESKMLVMGNRCKRSIY